MNTEHLFCDAPGCGRFVFGRHDDTEESIRRRAVVERGWLVFEHKDLCNVCRRRVDELLDEVEWAIEALDDHRGG